MTTKKALLGSLGAIAVLILGQTGAQLLATVPLAFGLPVAACNALAGILYVVLTWFLLRLLGKKGLNMSMADLGIPRFRVKGKWLAVAVLLPALVTGVYLLLPGRMEHHREVDAAVTASASIFFVGIGAGFVEEMVFRGFIQNLFDQRWGRTVAVLVPSAVFAAVHLLGTDFSPVSVLLVLIAGTGVGVMFSLIQRADLSAWDSGIVHALWNMAIVGGILTVSSAVDEYAMFNYVLSSDSLLITGGEFGIESSLIAVAAYGIVSWIAARGVREKTAREG